MRTLIALLLLAAPATADPLVIRASRLIDGRGHVLHDAAVVIDGGRIVAVDEHPTRVDIDLPGATLMPGGVDTHVHIGWHFDADGRSHDDETDRHESEAESALYAAENAYRTLLGGITTVQSLGAPLDKPLRDAIARGTLPGPRILTAIEPLSDEELSVDALRAQVDKAADDGADVIKVFASQSIRTGGGPTMSQAQMDAICGEAKKRGLRVAVHAHGPESVARAVRAGCTAIEHGALIDQPTLDLMATHGTYFDPNTDLVFRNYFENKAHFLGIGNYTEQGFAAMEKAVPRVLEVFKKGLRTPGLKMVFGTDAVAGSHGRNFQELEYRVRVGGQEPMAAITSATSLAAESLGLGDRVGTLAAGYEADLIAVAGDPLQEIGALERVVLVVKGGRVVKR
ncbi:MAG TPA: amidohydrolase family protein [Thermoanaerobaculia bacterium]|jgi:imidazolonepropionase-like amidohydrolase|nr:amidohydrolase family protein [Thermoanaerobaculia bacterium]